MFRKTNRTRQSGELARINDNHLAGVMGGMFRPDRLQIPGLKPVTLPAVPDTSFKVALPPPPKPWAISTSHTGGSNSTPQHVISAGFDNGKVFAHGTVFTPAVPAIPPMPKIDGTSTPALQTHSYGVGGRLRF